MYLACPWRYLSGRKLVDWRLLARDSLGEEDPILTVLLRLLLFSWILGKRYDFFFGPQSFWRYSVITISVALNLWSGMAKPKEKAGKINYLISGVFWGVKEVIPPLSLSGGGITPRPWANCVLIWWKCLHNYINPLSLYNSFRCIGWPN